MTFYNIGFISHQSVIFFSRIKVIAYCMRLMTVLCQGKAFFRKTRFLFLILSYTLMETAFLEFIGSA